MPLQLVPAADRSQAIPLDKAIVLFGRHPDCDVVITSSRKVSRKHCCIAQVDNRYLIRDLGSMNGVSVNGTQVRGSARIARGDEVSVGDVVFTVEEVAARSRNAANGREKQAPASPRRRTVAPGMISQDVPVVIPDEGRSFAVEESRTGPRGDTQDPIVLSEDDIIDEDD